MGIEEELKEREKELDCLYRLTPLFSSYEGSEDVLLRMVENELMVAMTYPEASFISLTLLPEPDVGRASDEETDFSTVCSLAEGDVLHIRLRFSDARILLVPREKVLLESVLRLTAVTLERLRNEKALSGKNAALTELLNHLEDEKSKSARTLATKINTFILPVLNQLEYRLDDSEKTRVKLIKNVLTGMTKESRSELKELFPILTPREVEVCGLVSSGNSTKEIALLLGISDQTVERHRCTIRRKLGISKSRANLSNYLHNL